MTTPYDGKIGLVFWSGQSVNERTVPELAQTIRHWLPNARALYVKTSDGESWQAEFDRKASMAIGGPDDIARWVAELETYGLEFHAWCVVKGMNVPAEADRIIAACRVPGVQSMLLDVEDGPDYFTSGPGDARHLIQRVRVNIPREFHLGLNFDARGQHPKHIHIGQWLPYVGSLHPMVYHKDFGRSIDEALSDAFRVCRGMGRPIYPMLQAYGDVNPLDLRRGAELSLAQYGAGGVSYFRLGAMGRAEFLAIQEVRLPEAPPEAPGEPEAPADGAIIIRPDGPGYRDGVYRPGATWYTFQDINGWPVKYKLQANPQQAYATYTPTLPGPGRYAIEVFIPHKHAEARAALYFVTLHQDGRSVERKIALDQSIHYNEWAQLGVFDLDPTLPQDGRVNLVDYSVLQPLQRIAFSAIRWRPADGPPAADTGEVADGFDPPIGTDGERRSSQVWPGFWSDANRFLNRYIDSAGRPAYHTGADLNLNKPRWNLDRGAPVFAAAAGQVTWAGRVGDVWRNIIVVRHDPLPDGTRVYTRYAHVENMRVQAGDRVRRGEQICVVGTSGGGSGNYHLHFDVCVTDVLATHPGHWPGSDRQGVVDNYVNPQQFIREHRP